ncbi:MAG: hypothetical protein J6V48_04225 [Clostridia bacterium]|nr:hypothetical protein [Clostridia bacterium]
MKKRFKKIAALMLALLTAAAAFASCAEKTGPAEDSTTAEAVTTDIPATAAETKLLPDLPDTQWDRGFRILGCSENRADSYPSFELYAEDLNGEAMNDSVYRRNETVKAKYGISVVQMLAKETSNRVTNDAASGDDNFDLVFVYISKIGALAQKGYFYDLNEIDYIDFEKPWWQKSVNDEISIKGRLYYTSSDFSLRDKNRVQVLACNDKLREGHRLDPVPELVRSNEWTAEKMSQYITAAAADLDGDGKQTANDCFGLVMHSYNAFAALCFGCGVRLVGKDENDGLAVISDPDHDSAAVDAVLDICRTEVSLTPEKYGSDFSLNTKIFGEGRSLFSLDMLHFLGWCNRDCEFEFTVAPMPKLSSDQENYCTLPEVSCMLFAVPTTNKDPAFSGFALEAFSYESTDTTYVTFIELYCKSRNIRNADSVEMVNIILDNIVYDASVFYSDVIPLYNIVSKTIPQAGSNMFVRSLNASIGRARTEIEKINTAFAGGQ